MAHAPARPRLPVALTIAGSDSGGGAGLQADLQTFASLRAHGTTVVTCLTAQNPRGVSAIHAAPPRFVAAQLEAVWQELPPAALKTGMLFSEAIVRQVVESLARLRSAEHPPLVVDPVMVATSGAVLLKPGAIRALRSHLLPAATLITPNLDEAALLLGHPIRTPEDLRHAARQLHECFGCAVLAKGGHLRGLDQAIDVFQDGRTELLLSSPFVRGVSTHGTGCTYSAAITALLARGQPVARAVEGAKQFISDAIAGAITAGSGHHVLHWRAASAAPSGSRATRSSPRRPASQPPRSSNRE